MSHHESAPDINLLSGEFWGRNPHDELVTGPRAGGLSLRPRRRSATGSARRSSRHMPSGDGPRTGSASARIRSISARSSSESRTSSAPTESIR